MYYGGFSYTETYNLPIAYKNWWINRIKKEMQGTETDPTKPGNGNSRAAHHNSPEANAMAGRARQEMPSRMRRFT